MTTENNQKVYGMDENLLMHLMLVSSALVSITEETYGPEVAKEVEEGFWQDPSYLGVIANVFKGIEI